MFYGYGASGARMRQQRGARLPVLIIEDPVIPRKNRSPWTHGKRTKYVRTRVLTFLLLQIPLGVHSAVKNM